jgi:hypothetical protein
MKKMNQTISHFKQIHTESEPSSLTIERGIKTTKNQLSKMMIQKRFNIQSPQTHRNKLSFHNNQEQSLNTIHISQMHPSAHFKGDPHSLSNQLIIDEGEIEIPINITLNNNSMSGFNSTRP